MYQSESQRLEGRSGPLGRHAWTRAGEREFKLQRLRPRARSAGRVVVVAVLVVVVLAAIVVVSSRAADEHQGREGKQQDKQEHRGALHQSLRSAIAQAGPPETEAVHAMIPHHSNSRFRGAD